MENGLTDQQAKTPGDNEQDRKIENAHLNIRIDQKEVYVPVGISVAAALILNDVKACRQSSRGAARGLFCGMGVCYECLVTIDDQPDQRACMTLVKDGMRIATGAPGR